MKYQCKICDYETERQADLNRHKKSQKHKLVEMVYNTKTQKDHKIDHFAKKNTSKNIEKHISDKNDDSGDNDDDDVLESKSNRVGDLYKCPYCYRLFNKSTNMYRHKNHHCKSRKRIEKIENDKIKKTKMIEESQNIRMLQQIVDDIKELKNETKISKMTTMTFATKHFKDTPPLKKLKPHELNNLLYYKKEPRKGFALEHEFIHQYKHRILHEFLGRLIISEYKNDNPQIQGLWSSDLARLTFVIRKSVDNSDTWIVDKKGVNITNMIISPMTQRTKEILQEFIGNSGIAQKPPTELRQTYQFIMKSTQSDEDSDTSCDSDNDDSDNDDSDNDDSDLSDDVDEDSDDSTYRNDDRTRMRSMREALEVILDINLDKLNKNILKYIAPHFGLDTDSITAP